MRLRVLVVGLVVVVVVVVVFVVVLVAFVICLVIFMVLHNDWIGSMFVLVGHYYLTVADPVWLSCVYVVDLFRQFLEDFDGWFLFLWRLDVVILMFSGANGVVFSIVCMVTSSGGGGGQHLVIGLVCLGMFQVLHNDRIGSFQVLVGYYTMTLLSVGLLMCVQVTNWFVVFLQDYDGCLLVPWLLDSQMAMFTRGGVLVGFWIQLVVTLFLNLLMLFIGGLRCFAIFWVFYNDCIDALRIPWGCYWIICMAIGAPTCVVSTWLLASFLQRL